MSPFLRDLTPKQAEAASLAGPVLVLAGAGTGKTKTLTAAVAHWIAERAVPALRILAVTFTNRRDAVAHPRRAGRRCEASITLASSSTGDHPRDPGSLVCCQYAYAAGGSAVNG